MLQYLKWLKKAWIKEFHLIREMCKEMRREFEQWHDTEKLLQLAILQTKVDALEEDPVADLSSITPASLNPVPLQFAKCHSSDFKGPLQVNLHLRLSQQALQAAKVLETWAELAK